MSTAAWKDLCIDVGDAERMGRFWSAALGLTLRRLDNGDARLEGPTPRHTVWLNTVPEPLTVKQRVHLDLHARSVEEFVELGATPQPGDFPWTVMKDPEGGEFCVFVREEVPEHRVYELIVDCAEPEPIARWWGATLGGRVEQVEKYGVWYIDELDGAPLENIVFGPVPEPKTVKNRIHWDVTGDPDALIAGGATVLRAPDDEIDWHVLADPDGNEFCCFPG